MLRIREAGVDDVPLILSFIRELAEYEREPNAVRATEDDLRRDGFSANPKFRVIIAESDGNPAGMAFFFHHYSTWQGRQGLFRDRGALLRDEMGSARLEHDCDRSVSEARGSVPRALASHADCGRRFETPI